MRIFINPSSVFPDNNINDLTNPSLQQWSGLDSDLTLAQQSNLTPILEINDIPVALEPQNQNPSQPNPCSGTGVALSHTAPMYTQSGSDTGMAEYAKAMSVIVNHVDTNFSKLDLYYEVWNEPNFPTGLCSANGDITSRLTEYEAMFSAAAPAMRAQMKTDNHAEEPIGINYGASEIKQVTTFFTPLLQDQAVSSNVDFITMHNYFGNIDWPTTVSDTLSSTIGAASTYQAIEQVIRSNASILKHGASTPVLQDEYNGSSCKTGTICRNDPATSGPWNSLFISSMLNSVFNDSQSPYGAAQQEPAGLAYWSLNIGPPDGYCMFGVIDSGWDCSKKGTLAPYPQYYAYQLFNDPAYLDIGNSAYMVQSSGAPNVYVTSFYTASKDNVVLTNLSNTSSQTISIALNNTRSTASSATIYILNQSNVRIGTQQVSLTSPSNGNYTVSLTIPALTTMAISLPAGSGRVPGDVNGDDHVTITDLSLLLTNYGTSYAPADFNGNGTVDIGDLSILLSHYGT